MLKRIWSNIAAWFLDTARVMRREFRLVFASPGAMLFFFALPLAYPIVYALIYNPEVTRDMPVAVIDNSRTAQSREFIRHADATPAMKVCGYAADKAEARRWMAEKKCFAVIEVPTDYSQRIGRGEQGVVNFYSDVSLLLRFRTFMESMTNLQMATDTQLRSETLNSLGVGGLVGGSNQIQTQAYFLGDTQQGFGSFILPGMVVLILQQSILIGVCFLGGASNERRRANGGIDPLAIPASTSATVIGKTLCVVALYIPLTIYILHYIPHWFHFPHEGYVWHYFLFIFPMVLASIFLGITLTSIASEKESAFVIVVFTSIAFLFLSGLTWPRYAMQPVWKIFSDLIPATWGVEGYTRINNNGATLEQQTIPYLWLWLLTAAYFLTALAVTAYQTRLLRRSRR